MSVLPGKCNVKFNATTKLMSAQLWLDLSSAPARSATNYSILFGAFHLITALRAHDRVHSFRYEFRINNLWAAALSTCRPVDIVFKFQRAGKLPPFIIIIRNCGFIFISCAC